MSTVRYKGYQGSVTFEDGRLIIQVMHIDDFLTSECTDASNVDAEFVQLVDGYLDTCKRYGRDPAPPFKGTFNVRIPPELHKKIAYAAADSDESLNSWVAQALEQQLKSDHERDRLVEAVESIYVKQLSERARTHAQAASKEARRTPLHAGRNAIRLIEGYSVAKRTAVTFRRPS